MPPRKPKLPPLDPDLTQFRMAAVLRPGEKSWDKLLQVLGGKRNLTHSTDIGGQQCISFKVVGRDGSQTEVKIVRAEAALTISNRRNGRTGDVVKAELRDY